MKCFECAKWELEKRSVDSTTGAQKEVKGARFDLIPAGALWALAEHYGKGAKKYDDNQWRKGMDWWKLFSAMMRHAWQWWGGEDVDEETGSSHLMAIAWHAFALFTYQQEMRGTDGRWKK